MRRITDLFIYPVKGLGGCRLTEMKIGKRGPLFDRSWVIVDPDKQFRCVTQREFPLLARVQTYITHESLVLVGGGTACEVSKRLWTSGQKRTAILWDKPIETTDQGNEAAEYLSGIIRHRVRLMRLSGSSSRPSETQNNSPDVVEMGGADSHPLLVISEDSLADLNYKLDEPVSMERFRPNIVVSGCDGPFEEDRWLLFRIGGQLFKSGKRCSRCSVVLVDPETGKRESKEPLKTLSEYRLFAKEPCFGMYANHLGYGGTLHVEDEVDVQVFGSP